MDKKVVIITGASSGIGAALARQLGGEGTCLALAARRTERLEKLAEEIRKTGGEVLILTADVTRREDIQCMVQATLERCGRVDVLFNNAGVGYFEEADKMDMKKFDQMMEVNVIGMASLTKLVLPIMKKQKSGQIINNASVAGKVGHAKSEFYAATKSAVMRYSEGLRAEVFKYGVKVSVIYTSTVKTDFWSKKEFARRKKENWHGKNPVFLTTQDLANVVEFITNQPDNSVIEDVTIMPFG